MKNKAAYASVMFETVVMVMSNNVNLGLCGVQFSL